jgi:hypothetical protein
MTSAVSWPPALPPARTLDAEAAGWRAHALDAAAFVDAHLVNRRDVWGGYWPLGIRETFGKVHTAPRVKDRGRVSLTRTVLARHFAGRAEGDVIGLHSTSATDTSLWAAFDIDRHGDSVTSDATRHAATVVAERTAEYGAAVLLEDSDGGGSFHVGVHFDAPVATAAVFEWLRRIADECHQRTGLRPETFPKQASASGGFGNWLRLPGRHHTKPHWSRLARPGTDWTAGADAVACLLDWPATPADVVPPATAWSPQQDRAGAPVRRATARSGTTEVTPERRVGRYLATLPPLADGQGRNQTAFRLAAFVLCDVGLEERDALLALELWNALNITRLDDAALQRAVVNARRYGGRRAA